MRKVIVSMNITLDGYAAGPHGEMDWHFRCWNAEMERNMYEFFHSIDTGLIGRVTYEAMAQYWPAAALDPTASRKEINFANRMNDMEKLVFSTTLQKTNWHHSKLLTTVSVPEINELKASKGRDMGLMGRSLIKSFMELNLVDEYRLLVHPVILGKGIPLFNHSNGWLNLDLIETKTFSNGVVVMRLAS